MGAGTSFRAGTLLTELTANGDNGNDPNDAVESNGERSSSGTDTSMRFRRGFACFRFDGGVSDRNACMFSTSSHNHQRRRDDERADSLEKCSL